MKLEDIDGDLYITDFLLESLRETEHTSPVQSPKYTVFADDLPLGSLKSFKSSPPILELEFETAVEPGSLIMKVAGRRITVAGLELGLPYRVGEIFCSLETLRCKVKAIHIEEVRND